MFTLFTTCWLTDTLFINTLFTSWIAPPLNPFGKKIAATIPSHTKIHVYVYNKVFRAKKMHGTHTPSLCSPK